MTMNYIDVEFAEEASIRGASVAPGIEETEVFWELIDTASQEPGAMPIAWHMSTLREIGFTDVHDLINHTGKDERYRIFEALQKAASLCLETAIQTHRRRIRI